LGKERNHVQIRALPQGGPRRARGRSEFALGPARGRPVALGRIGWRLGRRRHCLLRCPRRRLRGAECIVGPMSPEPNAKLESRRELASYCRAAEAAEARWHYSQRRPYTGLGAAPTTWHEDDCSSYVALAFWWAGHHTGNPVADPLGLHYSGWGFTGTALAYLDDYKAPPDKYRIGDVAIYGVPSNTVHMTVCRIQGTGETAGWSSFGQEAGPELRRDVHYHPSPLIGVYRHPALR